MEYDSRISIAYDTAFYGVLYFNTDAYKQSMLKNYGIADTDLKYFYSLGSPFRRRLRHYTPFIIVISKRQVFCLNAFSTALTSARKMRCHSLKGCWIIPPRS